MSKRPDPDQPGKPAPSPSSKSECEVDIYTVAGKTKYPVDAFEFVMKGLGYTVDRIHGKHDPKAPLQKSRHVSGAQLSMGLRDYAIEQYGMLAKLVLNRWRITRSEDFGQIVFAMVDAKLMSKTEEDSIQDFVDVFDFEQAFKPGVQLGDRL